MKNSFIALAYVVIFEFLFTSCATVPITGRSQLSLISNKDILSLSADQYKEVVSTSKLSDDSAQVQMLRRVGTRIQHAVEKYMNDNGYASSLEGFEWEFNLIDNDSVVNAWAMPGGKVAFYTGIMPLCQDEKGVAVVMGHEVAHAIANHGRERMSQGLARQLGLASLSLAMGENPTLTEEIFMQSVGVSSQLGMLAYGRKHESEADKIGLIFMAMAGYDPHEAPVFWVRMSEKTGGQQSPEWLSTHPSHDRRIEDLNENMAEAMTYYRK